MNNKGQVFFLAFMLGITVLVLTLSFAPGLKDQIDTTRNANNLDCGNESISTFDKATCRTTDLTMFYFIGGLIFIAGAIITARIATR